MADQETPATDTAAASPSELPYQSLYRRYRPQRFDEVKGQEHVTRALRNAVRDGKVAHAYLFSGPRGTGKTSTARILAMALNCAHPADGEPDGVCESCREIRQGSSLDVYELDAASNRKLDEMRDLLSRVALGTRGRWKVYIIDEVHQLTSDAASALLKTLEEPPGHVVFVLATTDPQKVLPTIQSRTQHFEFRLLSAGVLGKLLHDVNTKAGLGVAPEAIDLVIRRGHGSARDALSVLDQVAAAGEVESETEVVAEITDALADADAQRVLVAVAEGISAGREPRRLAADLLGHLRNGFLALQARQLVLLPDDAVVEVEGQARRLGLPSLVRAMEVVGQALVDMRDSVDARITLEVALLRLSQPRLDTSPAALAVRIDRLEQQLRALGTPEGTTQSGAAPRPGAGPRAGAASRAGAAPQAVPTSGPRPPEPPAAAPAPAAPTPGGPPLERPARGRSALGAHRKPAAPQGPGAGTPPSASRPSAIAGPPARPSSGPAPAVTPARSSPPAGPVSAGGPGHGTAGGRPAGGGPTLSRDDLTEAWADAVLPRLRVPARAFLSSGRFLSVEGGTAVFALPDRPLLERAASVKAEAEAALSEHFGRAVALRLVHDREATPPPAPEGEVAHEDPADYNLDDMDDAAAEVVSPEERLMRAFPGAKEVEL